MNVSRETSPILAGYVDELLKWNQKINLIGRATEADIWKRHVADSAQLFSFVKGVGHYADFGSGAGFPGLVLAALMVEKHTPGKVSLVESDKRKAAFLKSTAIKLGIPAAIYADRIESIDSLRADIVSARALAPLEDLLKASHRHMAPNGKALFLKGKSAEAEIVAARKHWTFHLEQHQSTTDREGVILQIGALERV